VPMGRKRERQDSIARPFEKEKREMSAVKSKKTTSGRKLPLLDGVSGKRGGQGGLKKNG